MNTNDDNREKDAAKGEPVQLQPIIDMGSTVVKNSRGTVYCLTIVGQVEGHTLLPDNTKTTKYEHVLPLLAALEQSEQVEGLLLLLNTVGGDIEAGLAIAELVAGMTLPTVTLVLGEKSYRVRKGDSFSYKPSVQYYLANPGKTPATVLWVSTPPNF